jgi:ribosome-associated protein
VVETSLDDDKAKDAVVIDLSGKSDIADYMVIATGDTQRHVSAMAGHLVKKLKDKGYGSASIEGMPQCDWVLVDTLYVIVHLFRPEVRKFYNLEKMWEAPASLDDQVMGTS